MGEIEDVSLLGYLLSYISDCQKSQEKTIPRTTAGFYITESSWLTPKEDIGANNTNIYEENRNWKRSRMQVI